MDGATLREGGLMKVALKEVAPVEAPSNEVTDKAGRKLVLREIEILDEARIVRMCGDASSNQGYMMGYVMPAVAVASIDGDPCPIPMTERELEFTIKRVGRDGMTAVMDHIVKRAQEGQNDQAVKN